MDVGKSIKRAKGDGGALAPLCKTIQDRMAQWTEDNFQNFEEAMELIKEGAPVQYVRLYMEAVKMGIIKESNVNININMQQDYDDLQALVRTRMPVLPDRGLYTPYEEVKPIPVDIKKEEP